MWRNRQRTRLIRGWFRVRLPASQLSSSGATGRRADLKHRFIFGSNPKRKIISASSVAANAADCKSATPETPLVRVQPCRRSHSLTETGSQVLSLRIPDRTRLGVSCRVNMEGSIARLLSDAPGNGSVSNTVLCVFCRIPKWDGAVSKTVGHKGLHVRIVCTALPLGVMATHRTLIPAFRVRAPKGLLLHYRCSCICMEIVLY